MNEIELQDAPADAAMEKFIGDNEVVQMLPLSNGDTFMITRRAESPAYRLLHLPASGAVEVGDDYFSSFEEAEVAFNTWVEGRSEAVNQTYPVVSLAEKHMETYTDGTLGFGIAVQAGFEIVRIPTRSEQDADDLLKALEKHSSVDVGGIIPQ